MSIEGKHAYRFGYLKSEKWKAVRLEALVREKAKCQICGEESISNDAHHIWYPESIYETTEAHLVILCRSCHDFIHSMLPECKTDDEEKGTAQWMKFRNAILAWRSSKLELFSESSIDAPIIESLSGKPAGIVELRHAYVDLRKRFKELSGQFESYRVKIGGPPVFEILGLEPPSPKRQREPNQKTIKTQIMEILNSIKKWGEVYEQHVSCEQKSLADTDFQI